MGASPLVCHETLDLLSRYLVPSYIVIYYNEDIKGSPMSSIHVSTLNSSTAIEGLDFNHHDFMSVALLN